MPDDGNVGTTAPGSCPGRPELAYSGPVEGQRLDVWLLDVDTSSDSERWVDQSVLDERERRHADALETPGLRWRYLLAHVALRHLLGQALDLRPQDVSIVRQGCPRCGASDGRPVLGGPTPPLHFSMSSSEYLVLLALASGPVGVDVEAVPSLRAVGEAGGQIHPAEGAELLTMPPEDRRVAFTRLWARKEAYLKGIGVGLAHGLIGEYLGTGPQPDPPEGWTLLDVAVPHGFFASAALRIGPATERQNSL